jgi:hypothetical protein
MVHVCAIYFKDSTTDYFINSFTAVLFIHIYDLADTYVTTTLRHDIKQYQARTYIGNNNPSGGLCVGSSLSTSCSQPHLLRMFHSIVNLQPSWSGTHL